MNQGTNKKILFCAFDAGGGNAVFPVVKEIIEKKKIQTQCLIGGPSREIFKRAKIKYIDADLLNDKELNVFVTNFKPDFLVSGTSAGLAFDKRVLPTLKNIGTKTIYILDYWANYSERFSSHHKKDFKYLPDTICVMDKKAKQEMITDGFRSPMIKVTGNPYFDYFQKNIKSGVADTSTILFVSQPYVGEKEKFGYDEFEALNDILEISSDFLPGRKVIIRPHPRENKSKFDGYLDAGVTIDNKTSIEKLLSRAGLVIGMNSMVLFQAAIAGKKVISYQPNLKTKDFAVSNELGLSKLITKKKDLKVLLQKYFHGKFPKSKKTKNIIVPHATKNIIDIITKHYIQHGKDN